MAVYRLPTAVPLVISSRSQLCILEYTSGHMRLPPTKISLSDEQQYGAKRLAASVVDQALEQYTAYLGPRPERGRHIDPASWRMVKAQDGLSIYKSTEPSLSPVYSGLGRRIDPNTDYWTPSTKLLAIGTLSGTLEDAMYGCMASSELDMSIRSQYLRDELSEHRAILHIQDPDQHHPFQCLGIKQVVRTAGLAPFVRPRDLVFIEGTGVRKVELRNRPRRLGIAVFHSVHIPTTFDGPATGAIRGHLSLALVFRQRSAHHVDLFAVMTTAPGGNAGSRLATSAGIATIAALSRVVDCALSKKLAWLLATQLATDGNAKISSPDASHELRACACCGREAAAFRSFIECEVCHDQHCHKCSTTRQVVFAQSKLKLSCLTVDICKVCLRHVQQLDPPPPSSRAQSTRVVASLRASQRSRKLERSTSTPIGRVRASSESRRRQHLVKSSSVPFEDSTRRRRVRHRTWSREMAPSHTNYSINPPDDVDEEVSTDNMRATASRDPPVLEDLLNQLVSTATETSEVAKSISRSMMESSLSSHDNE